MSNVKKIVSTVEKSDEFASWSKENEDAYLAHFFAIYEKELEGAWQVGYYEPKKDRLATFSVDGSSISLTDDQEIFKKENSVLKLDLSGVSVSHQQAFDTVKKIKEEKYSGEVAMKIFMILQHIHKVGVVWNVTYVTASFNTLNVKVDASSGDVVSEKFESLMQLGEFQK